MELWHIVQLKQTLLWYLDSMSKIAYPPIGHLYDQAPPHANSHCMMVGSSSSDCRIPDHYSSRAAFLRLVKKYGIPTGIIGEIK